MRYSDNKNSRKVKSTINNINNNNNNNHTHLIISYTHKHTYIYKQLSIYPIIKMSIKLYYRSSWPSSFVVGLVEASLYKFE